MPRALVPLVLLASLAAHAWTTHAFPRRDVPPLVHESPPAGPITAPTTGPHAGSHGGTLLADAHGLLILDRIVGAVFRGGPDGAARARLDLHPGLGELVGDGRDLVFVADRSADRIVRLSPGDGEGAGLAIAGELVVAEPHGLALTPDGALLLATSVADHQLVAIDTATLAIRWRLELASEPRGVAVARDGKQAIVGFLSTGALAIVDLVAGSSGAPRWQSLNPRDQIAVETEEDGDHEELIVELREARSRYQVPTNSGRRHARVTSAVGFVGGDRVVAAHQLATPQLVRLPDEAQRDSYGGAAAIPPLVHRLALVRQPGAAQSEAMFAQIDVHQPRAFAYDLARDILYVGGYGDDRVMAIAEVSQQAPHALWELVLDPHLKAPCGIDGLAVADGRLWVHCELSRRMASLDLQAPRPFPTREDWTFGPALAPDPRPPLVARGAELFRRGRDIRMSSDGVMACASCHPEGRADGLSWRLGASLLQTPILAGRVVGTAPFKWDGQDKSLAVSLRHTIERLGGHPDRLAPRDLSALQAFLEAQPRPRARVDVRADALARGRQLFASSELGCAGCHDGASLSDGAQHSFKGPLPAVDTPSLIGLGHSAPYYHDGSASNLWELIQDRGSVHDMVAGATLADLSRERAADLLAYLQSL